MKEKNWYVVEEYKFKNGYTDQQEFEYPDEVSAIKAVVKHFNKIQCIFRKDFGCKFKRQQTKIGRAMFKTNQGDDVLIYAVEM